MMKLLERVAMKSPHPIHKHASLVVKGGAILAFGYNHDNRHSEVVALSKLWPSKRRGCTIINLRVKRNGEFGNSYPCARCQKFLLDNGVRKVILLTPTGWEEIEL